MPRSNCLLMCYLPKQTPSSESNNSSQVNKMETVMSAQLKNSQLRRVEQEDSDAASLSHMATITMT